AIKVTAFLHNDPMDIDAFKETLIKEICSCDHKKTIVVEEEISSIDEEKESDAKKYISRARINLTIGFLLFLISGWLPLPLTLLGQFVGFVIGGGTLWVMWKTGKEFYTRAWQNWVNSGTSNMD